MRREALYKLAAVVMLTLLACQKPASESAAESRRILRVGYLSIAAQLPLYVMLDQKSLESRGFILELTPFTSSNELVTAAVGGKVDLIAGAAINVVLDVAEKTGWLPELLVLNCYTNSPGRVTDRLLERKSLNIREPIGLRGKKVASFPGSVKALLPLGFARFGLNAGDFTIVELPPAQWAPALSAGSIDAVVALEPQASQILADGLATDVMPGFYASVLDPLPISAQWASMNLDAGTRRMLRQAYEASLAQLERNPGAFRHLLAKYGNVRQDVVASVGLNRWLLASSPEGIRTTHQYTELLRSSGMVSESAANLLSGHDASQ